MTLELIEYLYRSTLECSLTQFRGKMHSAEQQSNAILGNPIALPVGTHLPSAPGLR
jgi:mannitol/fructose-specific phosphotransferase system IIA component